MIRIIKKNRHSSRFNPQFWKKKGITGIGELSLETWSTTDNYHEWVSGQALCSTLVFTFQSQAREFDGVC